MKLTPIKSYSLPTLAGVKSAVGVLAGTGAAGRYSDPHGLWAWSTGWSATRWAQPALCAQ